MDSETCYIVVPEPQSHGRQFCASLLHSELNFCHVGIFYVTGIGKCNKSTLELVKQFSRYGPNFLKYLSQ